MTKNHSFARVLVLLAGVFASTWTYGAANLESLLHIVKIRVFFFGFCNGFPWLRLRRQRKAQEQSVNGSFFHIDLIGRFHAKI